MNNNVQRPITPEKHKHKHKRKHKHEAILLKKCQESQAPQ